MLALRALPIVALSSTAFAFVPPTTQRQAASARVGATTEYLGAQSVSAPSAEPSASVPWGTCLLVGLGLGYAAAAAKAYNKQGANCTSRRAGPVTKNLEGAGGAPPGAQVGSIQGSVGLTNSGNKRYLTGPETAAVRSPVAYPIFTFRWLAVHMLTVPTVFFIGAIVSMQFIQR